MGRKPKTQVVEAPKRGRPRKEKRANGYHDINGAKVLFSDSVEALQKEVIKLNEWCLMWREKVTATENVCDSLREAYDRAKVEVIGSHAIINFLDAKLGEKK